MKIPVMLSIKALQTYHEQEPDKIELLTEGFLEHRDSGWEMTYEESELTGMAGVTTSFFVEEEKITLTRTGKLRSQMVFQQGVTHESLYRMEFGAMMISVTASEIRSEITEQGGMVDLVYAIEIENSTAGTVRYHLDIRPAAGA